MLAEAMMIAARMLNWTMLIFLNVEMKEIGWVDLLRTTLFDLVVVCERPAAGIIFFRWLFIALTDSVNDTADLSS